MSQEHLFWIYLFKSKIVLNFKVPCCKYKFNIYLKKKNNMQIYIKQKNACFT